MILLRKYISLTGVMCLIIKGGNYVGNKIIILANESTYFKFIIREIKKSLKRIIKILK